MYSFMGIGTTLYGKRQVHPDGSYVSTKWFIIFFMPTFPICSYRVWRGETNFTGVPLVIWGHKTYYQLIKVGLDKRQVFLTYMVPIASVLTMSTGAVNPLLPIVGLVFFLIAFDKLNR